MPRYSQAFKEQLVQKLVSPEGPTLANLSREKGISGPSLRAWKRQFEQSGEVSTTPSLGPESWSGQEKLMVLMETATLNEVECSEYCRKKGLYVEQLTRWKAYAIKVFGSSDDTGHSERKQLQKLKKKCREAEKEIARKEKALAEAAALLILKKKAQHLWGDDEDS